MLGYTREEYDGHHIAEFHVDQNVIEDILGDCWPAKCCRTTRRECVARTAAIKYVRINSSVYCENGKFIHTRCFTRDITERKRTESRLALQYAVTRILVRIARVCRERTERFCELFARVLIGKSARFGRLIAKAHVLRCRRNLSCHFEGARRSLIELTRTSAFKKGVGLPGRIWESGKPSWIDNVVSRSKFSARAGRFARRLARRFRLSDHPRQRGLGVIEFFSPEIREPDDELLRLAAGIGGQIGQFTERKRAEEERAELLKRERAARAEAEKANRLKDEFLATLSHELRTPLNAVIGWSRMLGSGRLDRESSKHALEVIERNAWAQKQIIEDILDVSRVITGKLQLNLSPVDLVAVVDAALDAVRPAMEAKEIKIETIIDASLRMISGDADRLQQVVWNVLSNAAKFTPNGGKVEISVNQTATHVLIQVKDTGPGIDPEFPAARV